MKRILLIDNDSGLSGSTISLNIIISNLQNRFDIYLLTKKSRELFSHLNIENKKIISLDTHLSLNIHFTGKYSPFSLVFYYSNFLILKRFICGLFYAIRLYKRIEPDIVFINEYTMCQFSLAAKIKDIPCCTYVRSQSKFTQNALLNYIFSIYLKKTNDKVFSISKIEHDQFISKNENFVIIHEFLNDLEKPVKEINNDKVVLSFVGGISEIKGTIQFLKGAKKLNSMNSNFHFVICGNLIKRNNKELKYYNECMKIVEELKRKKVLEIYPFKQLNEIFERTDILVSANIISHFSRPTIEAWQFEIPVIASDTNHNKVLFGEELNKFIYKKESSEDLVRKTKLLLEKNERDKYLNESQKKLKTDYSFEDNINKLNIEIIELLKKH